MPSAWVTSRRPPFGSRPVRYRPRCPRTALLWHDDDGIAPIELVDEHVDPLIRSQVDALADDVGMDRQLAAPAIDQDGERDSSWTAEVRQLVERGPDGAPRVQHVIDDHYTGAIHVPWNVSRADDRSWADGLEVITV